jgi:hypothetical protein
MHLMVGHGGNNRLQNEMGRLHLVTAMVHLLLSVLNCFHYHKSKAGFVSFVLHVLYTVTLAGILQFSNNGAVRISDRIWNSSWNSTAESQSRLCRTSYQRMKNMLLAWMKVYHPVTS